LTLILDQTYTLIEERMKGIPHRQADIREVTLASGRAGLCRSEQALPVFSPGTFPSETISHTVPVKDRVEFLKKQAIETKQVWNSRCQR